MVKAYMIALEEQGKLIVSVNYWQIQHLIKRQVDFYFFRKQGKEAAMNRHLLGAYLPNFNSFLNTRTILIEYWSVVCLLKAYG